MTRQRPDRSSQAMLPLVALPDGDLTVAEIESDMRRLTQEMAPLQRRMKRLATLRAAKIAAKESAEVRAQRKAERDELIRTFAREVEDGPGRAGKVAQKVEVSLSTVHRALRRSTGDVS